MRSIKKKKIMRIMCFLLSCCVFITLAGILTISALIAPQTDGYAAVGFVNSTDQTATVLLDDGSKATVSYTGTAPLPGAVYKYSQSGMVYNFSSPSLNWNESSQLSSSFSTNRPGLSGWQLKMWSWGGFSDSDWGNSVIRFKSTAVVFIRYSETEWRVLKRSEIHPTEGGIVTGYFTFSYNGTNHESDLIVLGNYQDSTGIIAPTAAETGVFGAGLEAGNVDLSNPLIKITGTGYAAVGKVDTAEKKAQVLFGDGTHGAVSYTGDDPVSGAVSLYNSYADGSYVFAVPTVNFGNSSQTVNGSQWNFGAATWNGFWDSASYYIPTTGTPIFIRYSATEWRLIHFATGMFTADYYPVPGYMITGQNTSGNYYTMNAFVVGKFEGGVPVAPTAGELTPFGGSSVAAGDIDLSEFEVPPPQIVKSGYAAIGKVDTAEKKARVLYGDGTISTVNYTGDDPLPSAVHRYVEYNDGSIVFSLPATNHGYGGNQLDTGGAWTFNGFAGGGSSYIEDSNPWRYYFTVDMPVFIRYGQYQWRVVQGKDAIKKDSTAILYGYAATLSTISSTEYNIGAFVLGSYADGAFVTPGLAEIRSFDVAGQGWVQADKDISQFYDVIIPVEQSSGYAAIGKVDTAEKKVRILNDNGEALTVNYTGTDPLQGSVYKYSSFSNGSYKFVLPYTNQSYGGNQLDSGVAWTYSGYKGATQSYFADSNPWNYYLSDTTPVFIRYGNDRWRILKGQKLIKSDSSPTIIFGYIETGTARSGTEYDTSLVVVGNYDKSAGKILSPGMDQTRFFDTQGKGWADGNVDISQFYDTDVPAIVSSGYAAVGKVDTVLKKARILTGDGKTLTVGYSGEAPLSGTVQQYDCYSNGVWLFSLPATNHGWGGNQLDTGSAWTFGGYTGGIWNPTRNPADISYIADSNPWKYRFTESTPVFIRYGADRWRVVSGTAAIIDDSTTTLFGYAVVGVQKGEAEFNCNAFVLGNYDAKEKKIIPPTLLQTKVFDAQELGWVDGNVDLSQLVDVPVADVGAIVEQDVCAVGEVSGNRAVILKRNGAVLQVKFNGSAPVKGELSSYRQYSDGSFSFGEASMMPANQTSKSDAWIFSSTNNEKHPHAILAGDARYRNTDKDSTFFIRYSETSWRLVRGVAAVNVNGVQFNGYINERLGYPNSIVEYMLVGGYNTKAGKIIPATAEITKFLDKDGKGWSTGNISLRFSAAIPNTGETGIGFLFTALLISGVLLGLFGMVAFRKKI